MKQNGGPPTMSRTPRIVHLLELESRVVPVPASLLAFRDDGSVRLALLEFVPGGHGERPRYVLTWQDVEVVER